MVIEVGYFDHYHGLSGRIITFEVLIHELASMDARNQKEREHSQLFCYLWVCSELWITGLSVVSVLRLFFTNLGLVLLFGMVF